VRFRLAVDLAGGKQAEAAWDRNDADAVAAAVRERLGAALVVIDEASATLDGELVGAQPVSPDAAAGGGKGKGKGKSGKGVQEKEQARRKGPQGWLSSSAREGR